MDIYDYNEDNLSVIAHSCSHLSYRKSPGRINYSGEVSCSDCIHWNGCGCSRNYLDSIASDLQLD